MQRLFKQIRHVHIHMSLRSSLSKHFISGFESHRPEVIRAADGCFLLDRHHGSRLKAFLAQSYVMLCYVM